MAETLAAIGLAGNIIQFISFSSALVSKSREIHKAASGLSTELVDLNLVSADIQQFSAKLLANAQSSPQLCDIALSCNAVATELEQAISAIQKQNHASHQGPKRWRSFRKALKCIWKKEHIEGLKVRLESLRDQMSMHLISDTNDNQLHLLQLLDDWRKQNVQANYKITDQIRALDIQLNDINSRTTRMFDTDYWKKLYGLLSKVLTEVRQLSHSHTLIQSLRYECMEIRNNAIKDAHKKTFDWIFAPFAAEDSGGTYSSFTHWLQSDGGTYWVTGKPGSGKSTLMKYVYDHEETIQHLRVWSGDVPLVRATFYFWNPGQEMQKSMQGLLQTLLYHILHACPDLVPVLCPERWADVSRGMPTTPWTLGELQKSFSSFRTAFQNNPPLAANFYFQVDGLDEYYGDTWDVINTLQACSTSPNIKLCLSSRPWNSFDQAFGGHTARMLRLHEWTRGDIMLFATDNLQTYTNRFNTESQLFNNLLQDIASRAQGVFLWVRLVVRSLRDGIVNADPVSILHERLRALPTDLEEFFEHILGSVEEVYRSRMVNTFLAALRTNRPLKMIHYYFLEQEDTELCFKSGAKQWSDSKILDAVLQTQRQLNGRFRGLLEPTSTVDIGPQTTVDFLHRTLRDFLLTKRMESWLLSRASHELNVSMAISRAITATYRYVDLEPSLKDIKLAIEFAGRANQDTGNDVDGFSIVDLAEEANERVRPNALHSRCGLNCFLINFAINAGHTDYLRYRVQKDGSTLNLDSILKHGVERPLGQGETFEFCFPQTANDHAWLLLQNFNQLPKLTSGTKEGLSPPMIKSLLDLGAVPDALVGGISSWTAFLEEVIQLMDGSQRECCWQVLEIFLQSGKHLAHGPFHWQKLFSRTLSTSEAGLRNTLKYLQRLLSSGMDPNLATHGTTLFGTFLRIFTRNSFHLSATARGLQADILLEFLRTGANVAQVYEDESPEGWLNGYLRELMSVSMTTLMSLRIPELHLLLKHGLDLNMVLRGDITIWYRLLSALHQRIQQGCHETIHQQTIHRIILISLQHGADIYAPGLPRILEWMRGQFCHLSVGELMEIERELRSWNKPKQAKIQSDKDSGCSHAGDSPAQTIADIRRKGGHARRAQKRKGANADDQDDTRRMKRRSFDQRAR